MLLFLSSQYDVIQGSLENLLQVLFEASHKATGYLDYLILSSFEQLYKDYHYYKHYLRRKFEYFVGGFDMIGVDFEVVMDNAYSTTHIGHSASIFMKLVRKYIKNNRNKREIGAKGLLRSIP